jgi:hypothetical protein
MSQLVFGEISKAEAEKRFGLAAMRNPCIALFGPDKFGRGCKTCRHLYRKPGGTRSYLKCAMRKETDGPGSDHRQSWPACGKYERKSGL